MKKIKIFNNHNIKSNSDEKRKRGRPKSERVIGNTITYKSLIHAIDRCENPKNDSYHKYGGRGIFVCERWHNYDLFIADMGERPSLEYSLDRIDNDGNYEPGNCRWATRMQQNNNKGNHVYETFMGKTQNITQWAKELNMSLSSLSRKLRSGLTIEAILTKSKTNIKAPSSG